MVIKAIHFRILIITGISVIVIGAGAWAYLAGALNAPLAAVGVL